MSAQTKPNRGRESVEDDHDRERVSQNAPPWLRQPRPADDTGAAQAAERNQRTEGDQPTERVERIERDPPAERIRRAPQPVVPAVDYDEEPVSEQVAISQPLRRRRSLEPELVPEPTYRRTASRPLIGMFVRIGVIVVAAVVAFALVAWMAPNRVGGLLATLTGHGATHREPQPAPGAAPYVVAGASQLAAAPSVANVGEAVAAQQQAAAPAAVPQRAVITATPAVAPVPQRAAIASMPPVRGVTDTGINFGMSAPFSGPSRELGREMKLGIETAFNRVNATGGINGRQLHLSTADDGYEPSRTGEAMKRLYDTDQVFGIIGNVGTPTAAVATPFALDRKMLFFGAFTGANLLRRDPPDRYVFNYRASYAEETSAVVRYLVRVRGLKPDEIAVFAQQDGYGDSGYEGVAKAIRQLRDGEGASVLRLNYQRNTIDVDDAVKQLRAHKNIKAVVMVATYRAAAKFIEKTRLTYPAMIYTNVSFVGSTELANELMLLGPRYANGVIVTQVVPAVAGHSTTILEYKSALEKSFPGEAPDYVSLEGYVAANVLIEGLKRVGPQLDTEHLVDALEHLHGVDLGLGTPITFGRDEHQASHKVWGTQLDAAGHYQEIDLE